MEISIMSISELLAKIDSIEEIGELLNSIDDINAANNDFNDETPLMWATFLSDEQIVTALLQHPQINPNIQDEYGFTALIWAASCGYDKIVTALLQHSQTDLNIQDKYSYTALSAASRENHKGIVSIIQDNLRIRSTITIKQTARLLYQNRYGINKAGFFAKLPDEINKKIAALTGDPGAHTEEQANEIATAGYHSVTQP